MMSQDNRLLPLSPEPLDRPLRELTQPVGPVSVSAHSEPTHLRDYLAVVLKRKWLILSLVVVVTSLVAIQMYRMPSIYEAKTTIQIEQKSKSVLQTKDITIRGATDPQYWNTQIKKLETQKLARQVIMRLDLQNNPEFLGANKGTGLITALRRVVSRGKAPAPDAPEQNAGVPVATDTDLTAETLPPDLQQRLEPYEDLLRGNLAVEPVERTNLVEIHFIHNDPNTAMNVANTLAKVFIENDIREETTGSGRAQDVLANQIIELQAQIQRDEAARINYLRRNDIPLAKDPAANLNTVRLTTYSSQLQQAEAERKSAEAAYRSATSAQNARDVMSIPEVQDSAAVKRLREKIESLQTQRSALLVQYTEEWPDVKKIDKQIQQLEQEITKVPREIVTGLKNRYEAALKKEGELSKSYMSERVRANTASQAEIGLGDLTQRLETNKQLYQTYLQRQKELQITSSDRPNNVTQIEEARLPRAPIGPPRVRNIIVALLLSLGAGIGLAFLLDYLDDTLKSVEDVDRHLHLPTLALIPAPRAERARLIGRGGAPVPSDSTALTLIEDVRSPVAEAYRHLRTSLLLSSAGQPPKTVLVTSSQPSEGKTTTAVNIAMMLAQTGAEVLLLDCDLRRPRIHTHFGLANTRGVTNYLSGDAHVSELVQAHDRLPNLKVIPSGPVPPNAAELLGSDEMRKLLYLLSENFRHIIIDSPPAISFTDASILSTMVDGVMLVVHGGRSSRAVVRRAKQQLQDVGAHIFGIVLNNVKLESNDYYYYSGYYASYYANDEEGVPEEAETAAAGERR
ncbi:MAG TPA: polysaccharide biosynthesis tyrosine autokinase [Pyrinomonadaceae bacterium]|nr:polysaccharide biosynthesis tyrosine autokinase [Pyrinomonadaceae bacterium]